MEEKYIVIYKKFKDLEDNDYIYKKGDIYPREGLEVSQKRIKELASNKNKIGEVLIKKMQVENIPEENIKEDNNKKE